MRRSRAARSPCAPPELGARACVAEQPSELFCEQILQYVLVEAQISHELLKLAVLLLKLLQSAQPARAQAAIELLLEPCPTALQSGTALGPCFDALSSAEPVSTSAESALAVECLLGDAHPAHHLRDWRPSLGLLEREVCCIPLGAGGQVYVLPPRTGFEPARPPSLLRRGALAGGQHSATMLHRELHAR